MEDDYIKFKILFACLILFISIASVSAIDSELTDANVGSVDCNVDSVDNVLTSSDGNSISGDSELKSFSQLNATIQSVNESNVVELNDDYIFVDEMDVNFTNGIIISTDGLIVDGKGHTINANNSARIFQINGSNITLKNINFINAKFTGNAGAILWKGSNGTVISCNFTNNTATGNGGAIQFSSTEGYLRIDNSSFDHNYASIGGGIHSPKGVDNQLIVSNSLFDSCNATSNGGAIYTYESYIQLDDCNFTNNVAGWASGVLLTTRTLVANNSYFINNSAQYPGAICINNGTIEGCYFINNTGNNGAAIGAVEEGHVEGDSISIINSNFEGNVNRYNDGSVILLAANTLDGNPDNDLDVIKNSLVSNVNMTGNSGIGIKVPEGISNNISDVNIKDNNGTAISAEGNIDISNVNLSSNKVDTVIKVYYFGNDLIAAHLIASSAVYGIYIADTNSSNISGISYSKDGENYTSVSMDNVSYMGLSHVPINITVLENNVTVLVNTSLTDDDGFVYVNITEFSNCTLDGAAVFEGNDIYLPSEGNFTLNIGGDFYKLQKLIYDNIFNGNYTVELDRNYTYTLDSDTITEGVLIEYDNIVINGNGYTIDALGMSRIFDIYAANVTLNNIVFVNANSSVGSAIRSGSYNTTIVNSTFENNIATTYGGAIRLMGGFGTIDNCIFINNSAGSNSGAGTVSGSNNTVKYSTFINNTSPTGGALYFYNSPNSTAVNLTFINNAATSTNAGALYFYGNTNNATVINCTFINNSAKTEGGAITFYNNYNHTVINSIFINNTAGTNGGAISRYIGMLYNCTFINNTAVSGSGGAVYKYTANNLEVIDSNFEYNTAKSEGGAIYWRDSSILAPRLTGSNFTANVAGAHGGAVRSYTVNNLNMSDCNFINNTAGSGSGGMFLYATNVTVNNCVFINNTASTQAGALRMYGNNHTLTNSIFENNIATKAAGGAVDSDNGNYKFIYNCTFINNTAGTAGGAMSVSGAYVIVDNNCAFINNTAGTIGGALYLKGRGSSVSNSNFINNVAVNGGALYHVSLRDSSFKYGGVTYTLTRSNCGFDDNSAVNGGAIYIAGNLGATLTNYTFVNNSAVNGGAVYDNMTNSTQTVTFKNSDFIDNTATEYGGAIYRAAAGKLTLNNVNLTHNRAGSVLTVDEDADMLYAHLTGLNSYLNAFYSDTASLFTYNKVRYWNGTQYVTSPQSNTQITTEAGKTTDLADAVVNITGDISGSQLEDYRITNADGDITYGFNDEFMGSRLLFYFDGNECYLDSGDSGEFGFGDFFILQKYIDDQIAAGATNISLTRNYTYAEGVDTITEGIKISADNVLIDGLGYTIDAQGMSRIFDVTGNNVKIVNTVFTNGSSIDDGGAVYWSGDDGFLADSWFYNNTAEDNGGAIYWTGDNGTILNSQFQDNVATIGSGIYADNNYLNVADNTFIEGDSTYDIYSEGILDLRNNDLTGLIYAGEVSSPVDVIVLDNDTVYASTAENVNLTAIIYDDSSNIVIIPNFKFILPNGTSVAATADLETGIYSASYLFTAPGTYNITVDDTLISEADISNGTVIVNEAIPINITVGNASYLENASILIQLGELPDSGNITINITGPDNFTANYVIDVEDYDSENITFDVPDLAAGTYYVTVRYSGNEDIGANSDSTTFTVGKIDPEVIINADDITVGDDMIVNVTLPADATGNITVIINNKNYTVSSGENLNISDLPADTYNATVIYDGDNNYNNLTTNFVFNVNKISDYNMSLNTSDVVYFGDNATVTVDLPEDATGNVTATVNGTNYTAPVVNGTATLVIPDLGVGNYSIPVVYSGDDIYDTISDNITFNVELATDIITAPDLIKYYGGPEKLVINVTDPKGNPLVNTTVSILINNATYNRTTDENGSCSMSIKLGPGEYNVTINAGNATTNSSVTVISTINGTDIVKVFRNATSYYATFRDSNGNYLAKGSEVSFNINGVMYHHHIIDDEGRAKLDINLPQGEYTVTALNTATGEGASNNITVLPRITENYDLVKYYKNDSQYTVKIVDENGNAVGAGVKVTFNINGRLYNRSTDENGVAKLNINLGKGAYIITAESEGCVVSNTIRVIPILTADNLVKDYGSSNQFVAHLVDGQGNNLPGEVVTFNINGVFYNRTTDSIGNARLNINLPAGEYVITSMYGDFGISNYVKVLP